MTPNYDAPILLIAAVGYLYNKLTGNLAATIKNFDYLYLDNFSNSTFSIIDFNLSGIKKVNFKCSNVELTRFNNGIFEPKVNRFVTPNEINNLLEICLTSIQLDKLKV